MVESQLKISSLLIGCHSNLADIKKNVLFNHFKPLESEVPTCRFRGTHIDTLHEDKGLLKVTGWQRNVARLRKMDVSLPTIISLDIDPNENTIKYIELDGSFKGSKGLLCSWKYLDYKLKQVLMGLKMDKLLLNNIKVEKVHCFHLMEVIGGVYTAYHLYKSGRFNKQGEIGNFFEEEVTDCYIEENTIVLSGVISINGAFKLNYWVRLNNVMEEICFSKDGFLEIKEPVTMEFIIDGALAICDSVVIKGRTNGYRNLQSFILKCVNILKSKIIDDIKIRYLNTNLYPSAFVGLLCQGISMRKFKNNYNYVMHVLDSLQRPGGIPLCIGGIKSRDEALEKFPGFSPDNAI